ncbi:MAG: hypothetical protein AABN95_16080 [Acidobacteriota bacterium]
MALTDAQLESVRQIVGDKSFSTIQSLCAEKLVPASVEAAMVADLVLYEAKKNKTMKMHGGTDGIDIDPGRIDRKLRRRVLQRLDLPVPPSSGGLFSIPVGAGYSDYC